MTVTAWTDPGTAANYTDPVIMGIAQTWINPNNAKLQDSVDATITWSGAIPFGNLTMLYVSNFGFAIPAGATINGVECQARCEATGATTTFFITSAYIFKAGATAGTDQGGAGLTFPATGAGYAFVTIGGATNLWGTTLTVADVNNSGFGVGLAVDRSGAISMSSSTSGIDVIELRVYYTTGGGSVEVQTLMIMGCGT